MSLTGGLKHWLKRLSFRDLLFLFVSKAIIMDHLDLQRKIYMPEKLYAVFWRGNKLFGQETGQPEFFLFYCLHFFWWEEWHYGSHNAEILNCLLLSEAADNFFIFLFLCLWVFWGWILWKARTKRQLISWKFRRQLYGQECFDKKDSTYFLPDRYCSFTT